MKLSTKNEAAIALKGSETVLFAFLIILNDCLNAISGFGTIEFSHLMLSTTGGLHACLYAIHICF